MSSADIDERLQPPFSDDDWQQVTQLAWRPAWRIRSRKGTGSLLLAWWRQRYGHFLGKQRDPS